MKPLSTPWILFFFLVRAALGQQPATRITMEQAIQFALKHNHALEAARSTIVQNQAQEITANLRPNPTLSLPSVVVSAPHPVRMSVGVESSTRPSLFGI